MVKRSMPLPKVYQLLEPGPVVLLSASAGKRTGIMTMSWQTPMEFEPPLVGCVISDRNYTYGLVKKSRECAINIPTVELASTVVLCGNISGRGIDKFKELGLTPAPASLISAPLVDECYANLECKVVDTDMVSRYGFFVLEVVKAWVAPARKNPRTLHHMGRGKFMVAGDTIQLPSRKS
jgi:flavin reductase (DIM6/NTAB) family NADH-FMN oxidoreductase RutF